VVAYLIEENRTLRDQLQGRRAAPHRRPASEERNHQGLDGQLLTARAKVTALAAPIQRRERVGGVLNDYYREAA